MAPENDSLEEIRRARLEFKSRMAEKMRRVRFLAEDDWLARGLAGSIDGMRAGEDDVLIAVRGTPLPGIGTCWTGLLVIDRRRVQGHAWVNEVAGYAPIDAVARLSQGSGGISHPHLAQLLALLEQHGVGGFSTVPDRCYDGAPTRIKICSRKVGKVHEASANAADEGTEPTLALAKIAWGVKAEIGLVEIQ
jgi:hypothetical protein